MRVKVFLNINNQEMKENKDKFDSEDDELQEELDLQSDNSTGSESKIQKFILENKTLLIIGAAIIVAVVGLFIYIQSTNEKNSLQASIALGRILPYYENDSLRLALEGDPRVKVMGEDVIGLKAIVEKYDGTSQGKIAALFAGNALMSLERYDEARKYFDIAEGAKAEMVKMGALAGLGAYEEHKKNYSKAAELYEKAAELSMETNAKFRYLYYAGMVYEKSGDKKKSEELYRMIIEEGQSSEFAGNAKSGLTRLGMIIE